MCSQTSQPHCGADNRTNYDRALNGDDQMVNAIIAILVGRGWTVDSIIRNVATKQAPWGHATVRVNPRSENNMYVVKAEYMSEGTNQATGAAYVIGSMTPEKVSTVIEEFLAEIQNQVNGSFAVRFLGEGRLFQA